MVSVKVFRFLDGDKDFFGSLVMEGNVYQLMILVQEVVIVGNAAGLWTLAGINIG